MRSNTDRYPAKGGSRNNVPRASDPYSELRQGIEESLKRFEEFYSSGLHSCGLADEGLGTAVREIMTSLLGADTPGIISHSQYLAKEMVSLINSRTSLNSIVDQLQADLVEANKKPRGKVEEKRGEEATVLMPDLRDELLGKLRHAAKEHERISALLKETEERSGSRQKELEELRRQLFDGKSALAQASQEMTQLVMANDVKGLQTVALKMSEMASAQEQLEIQEARLTGGSDQASESTESLRAKLGKLREEAHALQVDLTHINRSLEVWVRRMGETSELGNLPEIQEEISLLVEQLETGNVEMELEEEDEGEDDGEDDLWDLHEEQSPQPEKPTPTESPLPETPAVSHFDLSQSEKAMLCFFRVWKRQTEDSNRPVRRRLPFIREALESMNYCLSPSSVEAIARRLVSLKLMQWTEKAMFGRQYDDFLVLTDMGRQQADMYRKEVVSEEQYRSLQAFRKDYNENNPAAVARRKKEERGF